MSNPKMSFSSVLSMHEEDIAMIAMSMNIDNIGRHVSKQITEKQRQCQGKSKQEAAKKEAEKLKKDKRKLKKDRQKEKRNQAKPKREIKTEDDVNESEQAEKKQNCDTDTEVQEDEDDTDSPSMSDNVDSDSADIDYSTMIPAFVQSIVNQKDIGKKHQKKHDSAKTKDSSKNAIQKIDVIDDINGFTSVKKGTKHTPIPACCKTPEGFGNEALRLIRENEFESAIQYLNRGIALDRSDSRHYINRSYCYLRLGNYEQALADIKLASSHFTDIFEMSRAKCREGQALSGLQDYDAAEDAFKESINLAPDFLFAKRELKRTQIMRILDMGFKERSAILALDQKTTTMNAINLLSEESLTTASYDSCESPDEDDEDNDDIFHSDTEEDPSNVRLLSKLLEYNPNMPEEPYVPELVSAYRDPNHHRQLPQISSQDPPLRIFKAIVPVAKPKKTNQGINDMAVWIGSLTSLIKDEMITKRFSRFGKVVSVWRSPASEAYAFVNFQSPAAAQKVLEEAAFGGGTIEINGLKLPIKQATQKNKTIK